MKYNDARLSLYALAAFFTASCGTDNSNTPAPPPAPAVPVIEIPRQSLTTFTSYPTTIEGTTNSEVRAKISGYVTDVLVDEGEAVKKGQRLFKLETESLNQDAAAAKALVNAAQVEVNKLQPLVEKNIISPIQLETAVAKLEQAKSTYNSVTANINYGTITSPVDGYVGTIRLRKGSLVSPSSSMPLTTVSQIEDVYAYFTMNEKEYLDFIQNAEGATKQEKIANLPQVTLMLANGTEYNSKGTIETINSQINSSTGGIEFRARFNNSSGLLTNGSSGTVMIPKVYEKAIVVPQESTFEQQGGRFVFKVVDSLAVTTAISVAGKANNVYMVDTGLEEGDVIVGRGVGKLRDGMKIQAQKIAFDSIARPILTKFK